MINGCSICFGARVKYRGRYTVFCDMLASIPSSKSFVFFDIKYEDKKSKRFQERYCGYETVGNSHRRTMK